MKGIFIFAFILLLSACGFSNREVIEYRQVVVHPGIDVVALVPAPPVDVTITNIDFY